MTYCIICEKVTNDYKEYDVSEGLSSKLQYVIVSCEDCGHFKHQYLEEIKDV